MLCEKDEECEVIISMSSVTGRREHNLAGSPNGMRAFSALREKTAQEPLVAEILFLDFKDVQIATASFLRESVINFRDAVRRQHSNFYPVVANANERVFEELKLLIEAKGGAIMTCFLDEEGKPVKAVLLGELDPKQRLTFDLVSKLGEVEASSLSRQSSEEVKPTAWNNRLTALAGMGLIVEESQGRAKRYKRLFEEKIDG
jgi:hypothetical protein